VRDDAISVWAGTPRHRRSRPTTHTRNFENFRLRVLFRGGRLAGAEVEVSEQPEPPGPHGASELGEHVDPRPLDLPIPAADFSDSSMRSSASTTNSSCCAENRWTSLRMGRRTTSAMSVEIMARVPSRSSPIPTAAPIAAVTHNVAAVVRPRMSAPDLKMTPAPRNPIPVTICAAIRSGDPPGDRALDTQRIANSPAPSPTRILGSEACGLIG